MSATLCVFVQWGAEKCLVWARLQGTHDEAPGPTFNILHCLHSKVWRQQPLSLRSRHKQSVVKQSLRTDQSSCYTLEPSGHATGRNWASVSSLTELRSKYQCKKLLGCSGKLLSLSLHVTSAANVSNHRVCHVDFSAPCCVGRNRQPSQHCTFTHSHPAF